MKNRIKEIKKKMAILLKDFSKKTNYDYSNLSKIERGIYTPSLNILKKISTIYNIDIQYLIELDEKCEDELNEKEFILDINLNSQELLKKYNLILDGKLATEDEIELVVQIIRKLRETLEKKKKTAKILCR
jgi:transcriptional regulator with XRE-family HTH domain